MTYTGVRCEGGHHGHGHGEDHHTYVESQKLQTKFKVPTQEDRDYQLPKKAHFNERFAAWVQARWPVDRDDILNNDLPNKYSAYYWF